jgi:sarcosine oxidase subunit gamma
MAERSVLIIDPRPHPGRAKVRLRVPLVDAPRSIDVLGLPARAMETSGSDPLALWIGPEQWLLVSDARSSQSLIDHCGARLGDTLHAATDASAALECIAIQGTRARDLLAMASAIDFHPTAFAAHQCVRARFARTAALIHCVADERFVLYVDRSVSRYVLDWVDHARLSIGS